MCVPDVEISGDDARSVRDFTIDAGGRNEFTVQHDSELVFFVSFRAGLLCHLREKLGAFAIHLERNLRLTAHRFSYYIGVFDILASEATGCFFLDEIRNKAL